MAGSSARRATVVAVFALAVMAVAGCTSSAADYNDAVGRSAPPGSEPPVAGIASSPIPGPLGQVPPLTQLPSFPGFSIPQTLPGRVAPPASASATAFCRDIASLPSLITGLLASATNPADLNRTRALLAKLATDAPAELRGAVHNLLDLQNRVSQDLASKPVNTTDIVSVFSDPEYQTALQQVIGYTVAHCSISLTPPTT